MRYSVIATVVVAALSGCSEAPTSTDFGPAFDAAASVIHGFLYPCGGAPGEERLTRGGTLHVRHSPNTNLWVAGHPLIDGLETNVTDLNLKDGNGVAHTQGTVQPAAVDGTWEIR